MEDLEVPKAAIFDLDGTLLDSVDLHALAWHEAMTKFGHDVSFEQARSQIGKGGDKLIPEFLSKDAQRDHGKELEEWRGKRFKTEYLPLVRPFSAAPDLLRRVRDAGLRVAIGPSAKKDELDKYLVDIARIADLVDVKTSSEDAEESKPAPDIFEIVLKKLGLEGSDAVTIGRFSLRRRSRGQSEDRDHRRALRRVHRGFAAGSRLRRRVSRTRRTVRPLRKILARTVRRSAVEGERSWRGSSRPIRRRWVSSSRR
jgi:beta-phosphoglucomutase-like phosphatase (HAD superfamily)